MIRVATVDEAGEPFLTFQNLIELLFIGLFRKEGVTIPTIRAASAMLLSSVTVLVNTQRLKRVLPRK